MDTQKRFIPFFKWLFLPVILQRAVRRKGRAANDNLATSCADEDGILFLHGKGEYRYESVKTSQYQGQLRELARRQPRHECIARLLLDDCDARDRHSVAVAIDGTVIGVFPRTLSTQYREWLKRWHLSGSAVQCRAMIVAGPDRGTSGKANYRVKLDIEVPFRMTVE